MSDFQDKLKPGRCCGNCTHVRFEGEYSDIVYWCRRGLSHKPKNTWDRQVDPTNVCDFFLVDSRSFDRPT